MLTVPDGMAAIWPMSQSMSPDRLGYVFDREGRMIEGITNDRVSSASLPSREKSLVIALAMGERKLPGILAAVNRRLVNGLITDERTATALLAGD